MSSVLHGCNFHQHSDYSYLDGAANPKDICMRAKELGFDYVSLSDHGNVAGHIAMYEAAHASGLVPILGTELYFKDDMYDNGKVKGYHLCVWALNEEGLHNVWAISSNTYYATGNGHRTPNTRLEHIEGHGKGVACSSACLASALGQAALNDDEKMAEYFADMYSRVFDEFYIELHTNSMPEQRKVNLWLMEFAKKHGYKLVYAVDSHYVRESDAEFHDMWLGCQIKSFYDENHWKMDHEYYMQSEKEVADRLEYLGDDLQLVWDGMDDFLSKVEDYEIDRSRKIPKFELPDGWTDNEAYLRYLLEQGLSQKVGSIGDFELSAYRKQLEELELPLIIGNGLTDYFLIVADYCNWAKDNGILVGPARGSCTASLVCYLLGITSVNPMGQGLVFSRFLNESRIKGSMPDIDVDFEDRYKGKIHEYLKEKYGEDHVTAVGVTTFFGIKLALKEVCRYYRIPIKDSNRMTKLFEQIEMIAGDRDWHEAVYTLPQGDARFILDYESKYPDMFAKAQKMVGLARQPGKHAAGYVISPSELAGALPVRKSSDDEIISQFDKKVVEKLGFLKADLLGLRNLGTLHLASEFVKQRTGHGIDYYVLKEDPNDMAVWSIFDKGQTLGVFQLEGSGITGVAKALKPRSIQDIARIIALYRPGIIYAKMPDGTGMLEEYLARAKGKPVEYLTPELEPILKDSYGVIVYQEDVIRIIQELGGFTEAEADNVRAAIGHKDMEVLNAAQSKFVRGCRERGISENTAIAIYEQMKASGDYSFNRGHSLGYATITFWTAWMKAHYPVEYYTACMSTVGPDKSPLYIKEAKRRGVHIVPPSIKHLTSDYYALSDNEIAFGLVNVKGCGMKTIERILAGAPYSDFWDFVNRSGANSAVVKKFIDGGIFREWEPDRAFLMNQYLNATKKKKAPEIPFAGPYLEDEIDKLETEIFGISLSLDPFEFDRKMLGDLYRLMESMEDIDESGYDTNHIMLVKVNDIRNHPTKRGEMAFLALESDREEDFEATCFPSVYSITKQWLFIGAHVVVEVRKQEYNGKQSLVLNKVQPFVRK